MNDIREKKITWISKFCLFNYWLSIFSAVLFLFCLVFYILAILSGKLNIHGTWIELPLISLLWMGMIFWILSYFILFANGAHLTFSGVILLIALIFGKSSKNRDKKHLLTSLVIGVIIFSIALYIYPFVINLGITRKIIEEFLNIFYNLFLYILLIFSFTGLFFCNKKMNLRPKK